MLFRGANIHIEQFTNSQLNKIADTMLDKVGYSLINFQFDFFVNIQFDFWKRNYIKPFRNIPESAGQTFKQSESAIKICNQCTSRFYIYQFIFKPPVIISASILLPLTLSFHYHVHLIILS